MWVVSLPNFGFPSTAMRTNGQMSLQPMGLHDTRIWKRSRPARVWDSNVFELDDDSKEIDTHDGLNDAQRPTSLSFLQGWICTHWKNKSVLTSVLCRCCWRGNIREAASVKHCRVGLCKSQCVNWARRAQTPWNRSAISSLYQLCFLYLLISLREYRTEDLKRECSRHAIRVTH